MTAPNGAEGRFARIERRLDEIADDVTDLKVSVARIETATSAVADITAKRVSGRSYRWMIAGIVSSFGLGVATFIWRLVT